MGGIILIERVIRFIRGSVRIQMYKGNLIRFLNVCVNHKIELHDLCSLDTGYECSVSLKDVFRLKPLARKCGSRFQIIRKYGLPFFLNRHRKRKVFLLGLCCSGFFLFLLSTHIWNIEIRGNSSITRPMFMEYLQEYGVHYGVAKNKLDCKQMAADVRKSFSDLTWVSVKIQGTELLIDVQENTDSALYEERIYHDSDLVSDVDGEIVSMITRAGTPQVKVGDRIQKGQKLVLGRCEITDDSGTVVNYQYCPADADIYIKRTIQYRDQMSLDYQKISYTGRKRYGLSINIFGVPFACFPFLEQLDRYDVISKDHVLTLWKDFYLPIDFCGYIAKEYVKEPSKYERNEAINQINAKLNKFLEENEEKGVQIFEKNVRIDVSGDLCLATGTITLVQKAGVRVDTEYLELQQENNVS